jgi:hypothetical protein
MCRPIFAARHRYHGAAIRPVNPTAWPFYENLQDQLRIHANDAFPQHTGSSKVRVPMIGFLLAYAGLEFATGSATEA